MPRFRFTLTHRIPSRPTRADPTKCRTLPRYFVEVEARVMEDRFIVFVGDQPKVARM